MTLAPRRDSPVTQPSPVRNTVSFQQGSWLCRYCQKGNHNRARCSEYQSNLTLQRIEVWDRLVYLPGQREPIRVAPQDSICSAVDRFYAGTQRQEVAVPALWLRETADILAVDHAQVEDEEGELDLEALSLTRRLAEVNDLRSKRKIKGPAGRPPGAAEGRSGGGSGGGSGEAGGGSRGGGSGPTKGKEVEVEIVMRRNGRKQGKETAGEGEKQKEGVV